MKKWFEPLSTAWVGVVTHKLRSFLTMLGIVIGVAAVIVLMSIGRGAEARIISNIESMGSDLITIRPGAVTFGGVRSATGGAATLTMEESASTLSEALGTRPLLLGDIAAISLLVGGIGVMNIMLVSVLERTREIGIRKALGARDRDIWSQFLIEAAFLSFTGGIIGVILGWAVSYLISSTGLMTTVVSADIVILAVSVSVGIGLFFGFYPAWNASRLNPIEALRSE